MRSLRVEANITMRCNAICLHCNKSVGLAKFEDTDMTVDQMKRAVDKFIDQNINVSRFTFCGGEPILNKNLQGLIDEVYRLRPFGRVLSNGLKVTQKLRDKIKLPNKFKWIINPLDDIEDPLSGKNDKAKKWRHLPFWISPADVGLKAKFRPCRVRKHCGIGLDSTGFSMCGKAVMFGKLFGIDPTIKDGDIIKHISTGVEDICKHCQYGLPRKEQYAIADRYESGELDGISETFKKVFRSHKKKPSIKLEQF